MANKCRTKHNFQNKTKQSSKINTNLSNFLQSKLIRRLQNIYIHEAVFVYFFTSQPHTHKSHKRNKEPNILLISISKIQLHGSCSSKNNVTTTHIHTLHSHSTCTNEYNFISILNNETLFAPKHTYNLLITPHTPYLTHTLPPPPTQTRMQRLDIRSLILSFWRSFSLCSHVDLLLKDFSRFRFEITVWRRTLLEDEKVDVLIILIEFVFVCLSLFFLVKQTLLFTHSSRRYLLKCDVLFVIVVEIAWFFFFWFLFLFFCLECVLRGAALRRPVAGLYGQLKLISMYNRHLIAMLRFSIFYFACFDDLCFCFVAVLFLSVLRGAALRRRPAAWVVFLLFRLVAHATQRDVFYFGRLCWAICWRAHSPKKKSTVHVKWRFSKNIVRDFCKMRPNWAWQHRRFCVVNSTLPYTRVCILFDFTKKFHCWPFFRVALSADASEMHLRLVRPAKIFVGLVSYTTVLSTINWIDREILKKFVGANFENVSGL